MVDPARDQEDHAVAPRPGGLLVQAREDDHLDRTLEVLEGDHRHRGLRLRHHGPAAGDDSADNDALAIERLVLQVPGVRGHEVPDPLRHLPERMVREVEPKELLLPAQSLAGGDLRRLRERRLERAGLGGQVEQADLAGGALALVRLGRGECVVQRVEETARVAERAQGADLHERFEHPLVRQTQVDPVAEVGEGTERAVRLPGGDDRLDRALPHVLDRQQPEPDRRPLHGELEVAGMDVRWEDGDPQAAALGDRGRDLLGVVAERGQHARHVLDGVVRLEVRRLVRHQAIARGVGLVETVALERLEGREDGVDRLRPHASLGRLGDELALQRPQDGGLLLADRVAQHVRLGAREAGQAHGGGHDVLLVHEDPIRPDEIRLQERVQVGHRLAAMLAGDVVRDVVHRARPVERDHGRQVVDRRGLELADVAPHPRRLQLEDAGRLAGRQQLERLPIVQRDPVQVDLDAAVRPDQVHRLAQDRQVREAQEVELEEPQRLHPVHLALGHRGVRVGRLLERHQVGQRLAADHHPGRVRRCVPGHAFELPREVDDATDRRLRGVHLAELGAQLQRVLQADAELVRDRLRDAVHVPVPVPQDAAHVPDGRPGEHRPERDDLGHVVGAVLLGDVVDHLLAAAVLEVHVDVRHRHAVGVEEALEREPVVDRVHGRDPQRVRDDRAGRAPPAGGLDALLAGEPHEVGHDQEVACVAHGDDDPQLVVQARLQLRGDALVAAGQAGLALLAKPALGRLAGRDREMRDPQLAQGQLEVDHLRDAARVAVRLDLVREEGEHLGRRLQVELGGLEAEAPGRVQVAARPHAEEDVVGLRLRLVHVVEVVRHHERQSRLLRQAEQLRVHGGLLRQPMVHQLQVEAVLPEDVPICAGQLPREVPVVDLERLRDLAAETGGHPDQSLAVSGQVLVVDARLVVVPLQVRIGHEPAQVAVADEVRREERKVERLGVSLPLLVAHRPAGDVGLHADDRLDPLCARRLVEGDRAVQRTVVRQRERVEAQPLGLVHQVADPAEPVEERELRVDVEVREVVRGKGRHGRSMVARRRGPRHPARPSMAGSRGTRPGRAWRGPYRRARRPTRPESRL